MKKAYITPIATIVAFNSESPLTVSIPTATKNGGGVSSGSGLTNRRDFGAWDSSNWTDDYDTEEE